MRGKKSKMAGAGWTSFFFLGKNEMAYKLVNMEME
jgi:hypothetical protein